ncbi:MAG: hypothetical protein ACRDKI_00775 [Solirubrobacterales bacterium]
MLLHRRTTALLLASLASAVALFALPAGGSAATIGSNLVNAPNSNGGCTNLVPIPQPVSCTFVISTLNGASTAVDGLSPTVPSVITGWHVSVAAGNPSDALGMLRVLSGNLPVATSDPVSLPSAGGLVNAPARIPIQPGDRLGVSVSGTVPMLGSLGNMLTTGAGVGSVDSVLSSVLNNVPIVPSLLNNSALQISADIEVDADGDGFGDVTQDLCPLVAALQVVCPSVAISNPSYIASNGVRLTLSESSKISMKVERITRGHKKNGKCRSRARRGRRCKIVRTVQRVDNLVAPAGTSTVPIVTARLKPGSYRATITATGTNGVATKAVVSFKIKRKRR